MHSIVHKIVIETTPENLYQALNTKSGLSEWWTKAEVVNNKITLYFGSDNEHLVEMEVRKTIPGTELRWKCVSGPWVEQGEFVFLITPHERGACLDFAHHGWAEADDFFKHCNPKWGFFLAVSLKQYLESGKGQPHPADPSI